MNQSLNTRANKIMELLAEAYPDSTRTELNFSTPFELLVATVLSAQSTDKQVNKITRRLFQKYNQPEDFASLSPEELEHFIKGCGLYKNKSRNIIRASQMLVEKYNSQVPGDIAELQKLPGVGRKTANVILNVAFGLPAMPVDTHIFRVARRLGLASGNTPEKVEKELLAIIPPWQRGNFHHRLIAHGRNVCRARNPLCTECVLANMCPEHPSNKGPL